MRDHIAVQTVFISRRYGGGKMIHRNSNVYCFFYFTPTFQ